VIESKSHTVSTSLPSNDIACSINLLSFPSLYTNTWTHTVAETFYFKLIFFIEILPKLQLNELSLSRTKAKSVPLHAVEALGGGGWKYSSYSYLTSALNGSEWTASRPGRTLAPGNGPPVPIVQMVGWTPEPVWTQRLEENSFRLGQRSNLNRPIVQPVARLTELPGSPLSGTPARKSPDEINPCHTALFKLTMKTACRILMVKITLGKIKESGIRVLLTLLLQSGRTRRPLHRHWS
jgi:hypothetical protein